MTSHTRGPAALCALVAVLTLTFPTPLSASGPGSGVFEAVLTLWERAPQKFAPIVPAVDWQNAAKPTPYTSARYSKFAVEFDIPEFEEEHARLVRLTGRETDYVISAKKQFSSDAACLAYYQALLARFPVLLAADDVKISERDDHVFFKDKQDTYYRKIYVKHYLEKDRGDSPRVIISVRVEFPGE